MMKKILCLLLSLAIFSTCFLFNTSEKISASYNIDGKSYSYDMSCDLYEVSNVDISSGEVKFTDAHCYNTYSEAKSNMQSLGENYVVREKHSLSPSKIIAMNSGLAYSYPHRSSSTMKLFLTQSDSKNNTNGFSYVAELYEMTYIDTPDYYLQNGIVGCSDIHVVMNGFDGYCWLYQVDLVPSVIVNSGVPFYIGGNDYVCKSNPEYAFQAKITQNYYKVNDNGDLIFYYHWCYPNKYTKDKNIYEYSANLGPAPDFLLVGQTYYSNDNINYYSDRELDNKVGSFYPYYLFLPLRSKTNIPAESLNNDVANAASKMYQVGDLFINNQNTYGVNALGLFCLAINESNWGDSWIAQNKNNLYGWGAYDNVSGSAKAFDSVSDSVSFMMGFNLRKYLDEEYSLYAGSYVGTKGSGFNLNYASDPYWGVKIASYMYQMDRQSASYNDGNLCDYNYYTIGLVSNDNNNIANVYASPSTSSKVLFDTNWYGNYNQDELFIILGEYDDFYKIQSPNPIDEDGNLITRNNNGQTVEYNWETSVGYIKKSDVRILNEGTMALTYSFSNIKPNSDNTDNTDNTENIENTDNNQDYIRGDFNNDKKLTSDDSIYLLMSVYFPEEYTLNQSGDLNNDQKVTSDDSIYLLMSVYFPDEYKLN